MPSFAKHIAFGALCLAVVNLSGCDFTSGSDLSPLDLEQKFAKDGYTHLVMEIDQASVEYQARLALLDDVKDYLKSKNAQYGRIGSQDNGNIFIIFGTPEAYSTGYDFLSEYSKMLGPDGFEGQYFDLNGDDSRKLELSISESGLLALQKESQEKTVNALRKRFGWANNNKYTINPLDTDRVEMKIVSDIDLTKFKNRIYQSANLSFHLVNDSRDAHRTPGTISLPHINDQGTYFVHEASRITGECIQSANASFHPERPDEPILNFAFDNYCTQKFAELTENNIGKRFAVVLNGEIITAPNIRVAIRGGRGFIEGGFDDLNQVEEFAFLIKSGAFPAKINIIEEHNVGPQVVQE